MNGFINIKQIAYAEIEQRYACPHIARELRKRVIADGRISYVKQCIDCGHTSTPVRAASALKENPNPPLYDNHIQKRREQAKQCEYNKFFLTSDPQLKKEYKSYLASDHWALRRKAVINRANGLCEICNSPAEEVHHKTYTRIGNEQPDDLMAVCRACHELIHNVKK